VMEILDRDGNWLYVNEYFARLYEKKRAWFTGKNMFEEFPELGGEWKDIIRTVADTRETYVDRSFRGLPHLPTKSDRWNWNILVFPLSSTITAMAWCSAPARSKRNNGQSL